MSTDDGIDSYISMYFADLHQRAGSGSDSFITKIDPEKAGQLSELPGVTVDPGGETSILRATPYGQHLVYEQGALPRLEVTARTDTIPVLIRLKHPGWDPEVEGLQKGSRIGNILSAMANPDAIRALRDDADVIAVEASRGGSIECARSMPWIGATAAHTPPTGETGEGAIVAVIDEGIDVLHEAFRDDAGRSRILAVWDQRDPTGPAPATVDPAAFDQAYGTMHTGAEIAGYIASGVVGRRLGRDPGGHGTHVASIAAGQPLPPDFPGGVAPEAAIVAVIAKLGAGPQEPQSLGYSKTHVDALAFIRAAADKAGMPVAVNVSLGMNAGAHDGSSLLEQAFDAFSGGGRDPGYVIVKSAGNEFGFGGHAYVQAFSGGTIPIEWVTTAVARKEDYLEFWFRSCDDIRFTLSAPGGSDCTADWATPRAELHDAGGMFSAYMQLTRFHGDNGDARLAVVVRNNAGLPIFVAGQWRLDLLGISVLSDGGVHGWVERDMARAVRFGTGSTDELTLSIPATARAVISVGACASGDPLSLAPASSRGPTRDGRPKPELVAPGVDIVAAQAGTATGLRAMTGTSMAAPHVTGAVALLLARQARPERTQLNAVQVKAALGQTVARFSGRWQAGFGSGRIDVPGLLAAFP